MVGNDLAVLSAFILPIEEKSVCFSPFHQAKHFVFFKKKITQNQRAKLIF